ncbi:MAG: RIO1 family regulatory kinase/ATPase, partial [Nanoarchaeota archaeon]
MKLLQQGAEAKILLDEKNNLIIKDRIQKSYRHPNLDNQIRKRRTKSETKLLEKASKIINCPAPTHTANIYQISMPFIDGKKLSEHLDSFTLEKQKEICREIGKSVAKLHKNDIIHGDLTTSNMILVEDNLEKEKNLLENKKLLTSEARSICSGRVGGAALSNQNIYFIDF